MNDVTEEYPPRAPRISVKAPINLRAPTLSEWTQGWTINISRSGVLFALDSTSAHVGDNLEFVIHLSRGAFQGPAVQLLPDLYCQGRIVRTHVGEEGVPIVAASIRRQWLRNRKRG